MFRMPRSLEGLRTADRLDARTLLGAATIFLVAVLGVQAARLIWILAVAPGGVGQTPAVVSAGQATDLSILSRFDAFFRGEPGGEILVTGQPRASDPASGGAYQLYGVRVAGGGRGSAIIAGPDGRQVSVGVGEEIAQGVTLVSVSGDHAVIRRGGSEERLIFAPMQSSGAPPPPLVSAALPPPAVSPVADGSAIDRSGVVNAIGLQPRRVDGRVNGFVLIPRGDASGLAAAGLRPGDVVLTVNGQEITAENQPELLQDLRRAPQAVIGFERDGAPMSVTLRNPGS
jgi:general secretion pathway protein C